MLDRDARLADLLADSGFAGATRTPLAMDASTRKYERISTPTRHAILMDAERHAESPPCPPQASDADRLNLGWNAISRLAASRVEAFAAVAGHLKHLGLSAPEIYGVDVEAGYAIVEDLGDDLFAKVIPQGADEIALYQAAADVLADVHARPIPQILPAPDGAWPLLEYDALALGANADLFVEWLPQFADDVLITDASIARWEKIRDALVAQAMQFPRAFTIRDYHAENLIWLPERDGARRVGLLDFQDAVRGWRAWDFSMLLHDARRDVTPAAAEATLKRYFQRTGADEAEFRHELSLLGALNMMRILGIFSRLVARDAKPKYRQFMPRVWGHLAEGLKHPQLAEARAFVEEVAAPYVKAAA